MLPWLRSRYWRLDPWWTRWWDGVLRTASGGPMVPMASVWIQNWYSRLTPRAVSTSAGRDAEEAERAVGDGGGEGVGHRLAERGRQVVALARVVHDVHGPHVPALVAEPVVPVVDEVPAEDGEPDGHRPAPPGQEPVLPQTLGGRDATTTSW